MSSYKHLEFEKLIQYVESQCHSLPGVEYLSTFLPSKDKEQIEHRLNMISDIQNILKMHGDTNFRELSDVSVIFKEVKSSAFNYVEFKAIIDTLKIGNKVSSDGQEISSFENDLLHDEEYKLATYLCFIEPLISFPALVENFHMIFDVDGNVLDTASANLKSIRHKIRKTKERIQSELHKTINDGQINIYLQDRIVTQRNDRFVVPVKEGFANVFEGISHGRSSSRASIYIEPKAIVPLNNDVNDLISAEKEEIYKIFCEFTKQLRIEESSIIVNYQILCKLDTYFACARVSKELQAIVPEITTENTIVLNRVRHPLLILKNKSIQKVIPFDITLGKDIKVLLISGPNTGGKTVTLKTIGLCTLMALTGLPIPASYGSKIGIFSNVFADIGDNQSIESSLSTFSGHIENIKQIVDKSNESTLILIDEIGSATDPEQGAALAQSILEYIVQQQAIAVITTHYTNLKIFVENTPHCVNASMQFDPEKHEPTFQFTLGFPGNSFAIEIASKLGLNSELIKRAKDLTGTQNVELTELITKMNAEKKRLAEKTYQYDLKKRLLELKSEELTAKLMQIESEKKKLLKASLIDTQNYLVGIQKMINEEMLEIKKLVKAEKTQRLKDMVGNVNTIQNEIQTKIENIEPRFDTNQIVNIGDSVWIRSLDTMAVIIEKQKENYRVEMNGIFFDIKKTDIFKVSPDDNAEKTKHANQSGLSNLVSTKNVEYTGKAKMEINLLGKTFEESLPLIQELIDNALYCGLSKVRIVHGRGTGMLRQKIREYLKNNRYIQEYYSPAHDAGGDGVTVVSL